MGSAYSRSWLELYQVTRHVKPWSYSLVQLLYLSQVLKWVESAIQASKVHLLSADHEEEGEHTWKIPFDPSLKEVTISLSGPGPEIEVRDPLGMCSWPNPLFGSKIELEAQDEMKRGHRKRGLEKWLSQ